MVDYRGEEHLKSGIKLASFLTMTTSWFTGRELRGGVLLSYRSGTEHQAHAPLHEREPTTNKNLSSACCVDGLFRHNVTTFPHLVHRAAGEVVLRHGAELTG